VGRAYHPATVESSFDLLERARTGDQAALDALLARYLPRLQRWASGRLPRWARDVADTQDLVQETLIQTFRKIEGFDNRGDGALQAYLRQAVLNRIRDELRRAGRRVAPSELDTGLEDGGLSPLDAAIGQQAVQRYDRALEVLRPEERQLVVARVEFGFSNEELARAFDKPSANAARMALQRALLRLAAEMKKG
jgi:RNA polymerase sigma factor (sigma-70 family)